MLCQGRCTCGISWGRTDAPVHTQLWRGCVDRHREVVSWRESPFLRLPLVQPVSHRRTLKGCLMSFLKALLLSSGAWPGRAYSRCFFHRPVRGVIVEGFPHVHHGLVFFLLNLVRQAKLPFFPAMLKSSSIFQVHLRGPGKRCGPPP